MPGGPGTARSAAPPRTKATLLSPHLAAAWDCAVTPAGRKEGPSQAPRLAVRMGKTLDLLDVTPAHPDCSPPPLSLGLGTVPAASGSG